METVSPDWAKATIAFSDDERDGRMPWVLSAPMGETGQRLYIFFPSEEDAKGQLDYMLDRPHS